MALVVDYSSITNFNKTQNYPGYTIRNVYASNSHDTTEQPASYSLERSDRPIVNLRHRFHNCRLFFCRSLLEAKFFARLIDVLKDIRTLLIVLLVFFTRYPREEHEKLRRRHRRDRLASSE